MPSFGESNIMVGSFYVGMIRVTSLRAYSRMYPSLLMGFELSLRHSEGENRGPNPFTIYELTGELKLQESQAQVGVLHNYGQRKPLTSTIEGYDQTVDLLCELDPWRLEQVERQRDGGKPVFWVELWPVNSAGDGTFIKVERIKVDVPRDVWLDFLQTARSSSIEILEVGYSLVNQGRFSSTLKHIHKSKRSIDTVEYDEAVSGCRRAVEALGIEFNRQEDNTSLSDFFTSVSDEKRGKLYDGIVSRIKQLAGMAIHEFGTEREFSRTEAKFVVSLTERLVGFIAELSSASE